MKYGKSALKIIQKYYPAVKVVLDAKSDIGINVTATDCAKATMKAPNNCAMARAFKRNFDGAIVSTAVAYLILDKTAYRYMVPQSVTRELVSFDRHKEFAPGGYYLCRPTGSEKLGPRKYALKPERHKKSYAQDKRRAVHKTPGIRSL
jgi:hypothetical protein